MPTPDRTTIRTVVDELMNKLETNLVADPPTADKPFRVVTSGHSVATAYPRPFMSIAPTTTKPVGVTSGDRLFAVSVTLQIVTDVSDNDPTAPLLDLVGAVEDYMDAIADAGVVDGASGFDDREWTFDFPRATAGARVATAEARQTFVARVERNFNRTPAP